MTDPPPADEFEEAILAEHGPAGLRAVRRYLDPPPAKPKPRLESTEAAQPGQTFTRGRVIGHPGSRDSP